MTGQAIYDLALTRLGACYSLGTLVPKNDPDWGKPDSGSCWDCAEAVSWCVYQVSGRLYGCVDNTVKPKYADAYTGAWASDAKARGRIITVEEAAGIKGAAVLRVGTQYTTGHIVISDGRGKTVEAKSRREGVVRDTLAGRRWHYGILVPWIDYDWDTQPEPVKPRKIYRLTEPYMRDDSGENTIQIIQSQLFRAGFDAGGYDGIFGILTYNAVVKFQTAKGLVVDGEAGMETLKALGVE